MSEEPAGDGRLFPRTRTLQNKAEPGKICCVQAERRLLRPDGSGRHNWLLRPQRILFGLRLKLVVATLSTEKQPGIKAGPAARDLGGVIFGTLHQCVLAHFLLWPEPRLSPLCSPRPGVLRPSNPGSPLVSYVLTRISIVIMRCCTATMLRGALLRVLANRILRNTGSKTFILMVSCVSRGYSGVLAYWRSGWILHPPSATRGRSGHLYHLKLKDAGGKWGVKTPPSPPTDMSKHPRCLPANNECITCPRHKQ